jgi:hypothetical protein
VSIAWLDFWRILANFAHFCKVIANIYSVPNTEFWKMYRAVVVKLRTFLICALDAGERSGRFTGNNSQWVGIATMLRAGQPRDGVSIPDESKKFCPQSADRLWDLPSLLSSGFRELFT